MPTFMNEFSIGYATSNLLVVILYPMNQDFGSAADIYLMYTIIDANTFKC